MTAVENLLQEYKQEAERTRKMLEQVPDGKFDWKPHPKSGSLKWLCSHIVDIARWPDLMLSASELDFQNKPYQEDDIHNQETLMRSFEQCRTLGQSRLEQATEEQLGEMWTLKSGDYVISQDTKAAFIRIALSQTIHHRAQLGMYLRLLDVPIPGSYGPSADEM